MAGRVCKKSSVAAFQWDSIVSITRTYTLVGYADELAAAAALFVHADCPISIGTLVRHPTDMQEVLEEQDGSIDYEATVVWDSRPVYSEDMEFVSGAIALRPTKQFFSYSYNATYQGASPIADPDKNVGEGYPIGGEEGVDSDERLLGFQIKRLYAKGTIDVPLVLALGAYVGFPNSATWRGFSVGTIKLVHLDFNDEDPHFDHLVWTFAAAQTAVNQVIGGHTVALRYGWNHAEPKIIPSFTTLSGFVIPEKIDRVEVHQLQPFVDLNDVI